MAGSSMSRRRRWTSRPTLPAMAMTLSSVSFPREPMTATWYSRYRPCFLEAIAARAANRVIDILRGAQTEKSGRFGHDRLPTFGVGADRGKNEWRSLVRQMVATGYLRLDIAGYGGLGITDRGRALLRGEAAFLYREDTVIVRRPALSREPRPSRGKDWAEQPMVEGEAALLAVLKALRLDLARERGVPAYVVFPNRALIDMVRRRPRSEAEFAAVNGVGAAKLKQFAGPFLAAIDTALSDTGDGGTSAEDAP